MFKYKDDTIRHASTNQAKYVKNRKRKKIVFEDINYISIHFNYK